MIRITAISDTHNKHKRLLNLPGGDLIIHSGDISSVGYTHEVQNFCKWFSDLTQYQSRVFISGNHDFLFQDAETTAKAITDQYPNIDYLKDSIVMLGNERPVKIYGSPWQPEFGGWAFNLPRNGAALKAKWDEIPEDTDILITHGPPQGFLDKSGEPHNTPLLGCELLRERIEWVKPRIHIFGHIHGSYGYHFDGHTHFINASVLDEYYEQVYKPLTFDWDPDTNELIFI